jgi:hypothetical protein
MEGGCLREVRWKVTTPAVEVKIAVVGCGKTSVPLWNGLPQPAGGFPRPSDRGGEARQEVPRTRAHLTPQWV